FSSRRRHTRSDRDWSSDVCSSDLSVGNVAGSPSPSIPLPTGEGNAVGRCRAPTWLRLSGNPQVPTDQNDHCAGILPMGTFIRLRSEERRVGKECRNGMLVETHEID